MTDSQLFPHNNRKSSFDLVNLLNVCLTSSSNHIMASFREVKLKNP